MPEHKLRLTFNFRALASNYFARLQELLDTVRVLRSSLTVVQEPDYTGTTDFISVQLAGISVRAFADARPLAEDWLLSAFLRDCIEVTGVFLDECLTVCAAVELVRKGKATQAQVEDVMKTVPARVHKLSLPAKLDQLKTQFAIEPGLTRHVLSLNKARTCIAHRLGIVSAKDATDGKDLVVMWRTLQLVARENDTGKELVLDRPNLVVERESSVSIRALDHERRFALGEKIRLAPYEVTCSLFTFLLYGHTLVHAIEQFGEQAGIALK